MRTRTTWLIVLASVGSCQTVKDWLGQEPNPVYCEAHPQEQLCKGAFPDATPSGCTTNDECAAPTAVCETASRTCVECTPAEPAACTGTTPVCGDNDACRACSAHGECASAVCLPDGSCADEGNVAYVAQGGGGTACTRTAPCGTLDAGLQTNKPTVKIAAGLVKDNKPTTIDGKNVTILADPGAKLDRDGDGATLVVKSAGANVSIFDLELTGQTGLTDSAIELQPNGGAPQLTLTRVTVDGNQGGGISASGGTLSISRSTISGNAGGGIAASGGTLSISRSTISGNAGGGITVAGAGARFDITNSFITRNGNPSTSDVGGVSLSTSTTGNRFEFNTVVDNGIRNNPLSAGGVVCSVTAFTAPNNVIARNFVNNDPGQANSNTIGLCTYPTSAIATTVNALQFVSADNTPFDYHLMAGSTAIDQATTPTTVTNDFDGDTRPQGPAPDQGADEVR
jgi:hypothetical protein